MGYSGFDNYIEETTVNEKVLYSEFYKIGSAAEGAGFPHSLWKAGVMPAAGADGASTPGTAHTLSNGSLAMWGNESPATKHLVSMYAHATTACTLVLYDRLVSVNISINSTGAKTVNSTALPRYTGTDSVGVQVWLEVTAATSTQAVVNMSSYTDQDGNNAQTGGNITFPATATNVDCFVGPMPLASGDTGVRSVETITVSTTGGGSAAVNVVLMRPLASLPMNASTGTLVDFVSMIPSMKRIHDGATLALYYIPSAGTATSFWGSIDAGYAG